MEKTFRFLLVFLLAISTSVVFSEDEDLSEVEKITLKPKIKISSISPIKYEITLEYLMPYLERIMIIDELNLKQGKNNKKDSKKNRIFPIRVPSIKTLFNVKKKQEDTFEPNKRYVIGLEKKSFKMAGTDDRVFVAGLEKDNYSQYVFVDGRESYYHPETKEYLGTEMLVIGKAIIVRRATLSLLEINSAQKPIKPGTLIMPSKSLDLSEKIQAFTPDKPFKGYVLSVIPGIKKGATNNSVIVSIGARDGAKIGHILKVKNVDLVFQDPYKSKKQYVTANNISKGEVVIYDVFDKLSLGLVVKSVEDIRALDQVE